MTFLEFIILLLIAALAGALGQLLSGYSWGGYLVSVIVGFIGAFIGHWIARQFDLSLVIPITIGGQTFPFVWSIIGSAVFSIILGLFTRRTTD